MGSLRRYAMVGWLSLGLLAPLHAVAQAAETEESEEPSAPSTETAEYPFYDPSSGITAPAVEARGWDIPPGTEPEDVVLAPPRVILSIPRMTLQVVFFPIQGLIYLTEHGNVVAHVNKVLYWNDAHTVGFLPLFSYSSDYGFTAGVRVFHKDLFGHDEHLRVKARFGGRYKMGYEFRFGGDRLGGSRLWLETLVRYEVEPGLYFAGLGIPDGLAPHEGLADPREASIVSYFHQERFLGLLRLGTTMGQPGRQAQVGATAIFNRREFGQDETGKASIDDVYDTAAIPGFDRGVTELELDGTLVVDTRRTPGLDSTGGYLELFGGAALPVNGYAFAHYGLELSGTINLYRHNRLLTFRTALEAVHGPTERIPFTSLPRLGGADRLRGYHEDQFRDEKFILGSVEYHYPIHANIHGELFFDAGHVAGEYEELFGDMERWKLGGGGGLIFGSMDSVFLRVELAYGDGFHFFLSTDLAAAFEGRSTLL